MESQLQAHREKNFTFSPREFILKYLKYLPWILIFLAIMFILAYFKLRYSTDIYNVKGSLLIQNDKNKPRGNEKFDDFLMFNSGANLSNEKEVLKSRPMLTRVVKRLGLQTSYFNKGNIKTSRLYRDSPLRLDVISLKDSVHGCTFEIEVKDEKQYTVNKGSETRAFGEIFENNIGVFRILKTGHGFRYFASKEFQINWQPALAVASDIRSGMDIAQINEQSNILTITYATPNIELGKDIINTLMEEYDYWNIEDNNKMAFNILKFIDERTDSIRQELDRVEGNLKNFREQNQLLDIQEQSNQFFNNYEETDKLLTEQEVKIKVVDYILDYLNNNDAKYKIVPPNLTVPDPTLAALITQYNELALRRESSLSSNIPPQNPIIINLEASMGKLKQDIIENLRNIRQTYLIARADLSSKSKQVQTLIKSVPGKAMKLLDIQRQQKIKEELYVYLLTKKEETAITAASTISNSRVIESAIGVDIPILPKRQTTYLTAFLIGLALPVGIIILVEYLNDKVTSKQELERITSAPIIGEVGHSDETRTLVVTDHSRRFIAEQFRIIRTNLQYVNRGEKVVVLVTSSFSGEGKSFVSTNMGAVMALTGKKTVVLEFDIRKPKVLEGLNISRKTGITNYIVGSASLEELPIEVPDVKNLYVISCGPVPPNPAELLLDEKIRELFAYARKNFDVVIVDTAPVGLVSDAIILSQYVDSTLFIIRQGYTFKKQVEFINELYVNNKMPKISLIINDIKSGPGYGGHYGYGYGYGYGKDYFDDGRKGNFIKRLFTKKKRH